MSESQSRYSIVERLSTKKLALLDELEEIESKIQDKENALAEKTRELIQWENIVKLQMQQDLAAKEGELMSMREKIEYLKSRKDQKTKTIQEKVKVVDAAIKSVEEVSKTSSQSGG